MQPFVVSVLCLFLQVTYNCICRKYMPGYHPSNSVYKRYWATWQMKHCDLSPDPFLHASTSQECTKGLGPWCYLLTYSCRSHCFLLENKYYMRIKVNNCNTVYPSSLLFLKALSIDMLLFLFIPFLSSYVCQKHTVNSAGKFIRDLSVKLSCWTFRPRFCYISLETGCLVVFLCNNICLLSSKQSVIHNGESVIITIHFLFVCIYFYLSHWVWLVLLLVLPTKMCWLVGPRRNAFSITMPILWNIIPLEIKLALTVLAICKALKPWFCVMAWAPKNVTVALLTVIFFNYCVSHPESLMWDT